MSQPHMPPYAADSRDTLTAAQLATARALSAIVVAEITGSHEQVWLDSAGREWKPLSTGGGLLWTETVVVPLTRSEVEERFGELTARQEAQR